MKLGPSAGFILFASLPFLLNNFLHTQSVETWYKVMRRQEDDYAI